MEPRTEPSHSAFSTATPGIRTPRPRFIHPHFAVWHGILDYLDAARVSAIQAGADEEQDGPRAHLDHARNQWHEAFVRTNVQGAESEESQKLKDYCDSCQKLPPRFPNGATATELKLLGHLLLSEMEAELRAAAIGARVDPHVAKELKRKMNPLKEWYGA